MNETAATVAPGALMFAEAASAHLALSAQAKDERFAAIGAKLRALKPRAVATCARGSSDHAATFAKYLIETRAGVLTASVAPSIASVYHARAIFKDTLFIVISQSGASPDLIAAARDAQRSGAFVLALVNAPNAPVTQFADETIALGAWPERSVAATKSFIASLGALVRLVAHWTEDSELLGAIDDAPALLQRAWGLDWSAAKEALSEALSLYVIGRGLGFGAAGEAALKLKETCRIHAEAFSAAEVRHGPMALVRSGFPALLLGQSDETRADIGELASDMSERGARVFLAGAAAEGATTLPTLSAHAAIEPMLLVQSFYRLAHDVALARGCDPDRPPHLRKVTETV